MTDEAIDAGSQPTAESVATPDSGTAPGQETDTQTDPNVTSQGERLDRQTRNWRALERDRDHWREMALRQPPQQPEHAPVVQPTRDEDRAKTLADFEFDEMAYHDYLFKQTEQRAMQAAETKLRERDEAEVGARRIATFKARAASFAKGNPDFDGVIDRVGRQVSRDLATEILDSQEGPAISMYLDANPDELNRLNGLSAREVAREVMRMEQQLSAERDKSKSKVAGEPPAPTPKIGGTSANAALDDFTKKSDNDWFRARSRATR